MKKWTKRAGYALGAFGVVLLIAAVTIYAATEMRFRKEYRVNVGRLAVDPGEVSVKHGKHIATIRGCIDCHGEDLGGKPFLEDGAVAMLYASNLTTGEGGVGGRYADRDWVRAIRHGLGPDGKPLLFMPSFEYQTLSDQDTADLIAYLKSVPPVDRRMAANSVGPVGRVLFLLGKLPLVPAEVIDHKAVRVASVAAAATPEYGAYLATSCTGCHGPGFSGGPIPGTPPHFPPAANITLHETGIGTWTEADFIRALRTGKRPDGSVIDEAMPWRLSAKMTDVELAALWAYVQTLPAKAYGGR